MTSSSSGEALAWGRDEAGAAGLSGSYAGDDPSITLSSHGYFAILDWLKESAGQLTWEDRRRGSCNRQRGELPFEFETRQAYYELSVACQSLLSTLPTSPRARDHNRSGALVMAYRPLRLRGDLLSAQRTRDIAARQCVERRRDEELVVNRRGELGRHPYMQLQGGATAPPEPMRGDDGRYVVTWSSEPLPHPLASPHDNGGLEPRRLEDLTPLERSERRRFGRIAVMDEMLKRDNQLYWSEQVGQGVEPAEIYQHPAS